LLATAAAAVALALWSGSVIVLWKNLGSVGTPMLLLPLILAHSGRQLAGTRVVTAMIAAGVVSGGWLLLGRGGPWLGIEAIFPGLSVSAAIIVPAILSRSGPDPE
jgi:hypothetical protein